MQFRVRPSSKKSSHHDGSLVEFPTSKSLKGPDSPLPRTLGSRLDHLEAALSSFQEMYKRDRELGNAGFVESQKRLDKVEYKMFSAEQELRQLGELRELKQPREMAQHPSEPSKNQIMLLKQVILQEKDAQRELAKHQNSQIEQLSLKLLRQEQEMRQLVGQQRLQWEQRISGQESELREVETLKTRKMDQQYEMIKGVIANAERKIYEELERKIRNQTVIKDFVQDKMAQLREEIGAEQRQTLVSETKFIRQTKQSLESLFSITSKLKKQLSDQLAETQKLATASIKKLSLTLDISREKSLGELRQATELHQETANELVELRNFVTARLEQNRQIIHDFEEQALEKIDNGGHLSSGGSAAAEGDPERFSLFQKQINHWKSLTEQKNLNVFKQISNTLKAMKLEWRKENDELVSEVAALNESLKSQKKSGPIELKKSVQALVSIFNNEFDVLAEELQTLTDMIALAKKENEKTLKEELNRLKFEIQEEIKTAVGQKGKECNLYCDKAVGRSEENMKGHVAKEIKFVNEALSQRIEKNEGTISQFDTSMKKMSLLTSSQLEDYSVKLKGFNDNYKDYLQEQRKEDMKRRIDLEESMRKNAQNLMDVYYKKSQLLVQALKNNIEVSQMKEKVETAQALEKAKDELKKEVQGARQQWQKELSQGVQKLSKERQTSEQMLHQTIGEQINNAKRALSNEIGNSKLELDQKIVQLQKKEEERRAEQQENQLQFKNTVLGMLRDEKKLTQQKFLANKQEAETKITGLEGKVATLEKSTKEKETQAINRESANKSEMQTLISTEIEKSKNVQKEEMANMKAALQQKIDKQKVQTEGKITKLETESKKQSDDKIKTSQQSKQKSEQLQAKIKANQQALENKLKDVTAQLQNIEKNKQKTEELETRMTTNKENIQRKIQEITTKLDELKKSLGDKQLEAEKEKSASQNQTQNKQDELEKKMTLLTQDIETANKVNAQKIEEVNRKLQEVQASAEKKEGEGKQVGESSLNKVKTDLEKEIQSISARIEELQSHDKGQQNEQAIASIRKSVNKLQAMVFSEQAKNKAMFDRLTEDINKVTENVQLLTNEMMQ